MQIPPPYDNPPSVGIEFSLIVWAFNELSRERDLATIDGKSVRVPRISYRAIREWAEFRGYAHDSEIMDELYTLVRVMDTIWVEAETRRIKLEAGKKHGKPP